MCGRCLRFIAWLCLAVLACAAGAATPGEIPETTSLLVDEAGALSESERPALLARLKAFQDTDRAQVGILISKGTGGEPLAQYSMRVAESWKLGRAGRDDGLLIVVIPSPAAVRLEVGYGLEGVIPDARASQWLAELFPAVKRNEIAGGLDHLLDQIDGVLPKPEVKKATGDDNFLFPDHPEWRLPFVLVVFCPFALFPLFIGRWGGVASAPLLAGFLGGAAWALWGSSIQTAAIAAFAFMLPLLWGLNGSRRRQLPRWLEYAKVFGNLAAVLLFFSVITLFVGAGLQAEANEYAWGAPIFAGLLALGLAVFLFPKAADRLMVVLRSACHFVFILIVAYVALQPFNPHPLHMATLASAAITALIAAGLYLDSRERARGESKAGMRASHWIFVLAMLLILPFGLFALVLAIGGEDLQTRLTQGAAGGGSIAGMLGLAARFGLFAAVKVGLGGLFGGGGAERSD